MDLKWEKIVLKHSDNSFYLFLEAKKTFIIIFLNYWIEFLDKITLKHYLNLSTRS